MITCGYNSDGFISKLIQIQRYHVTKSCTSLRHEWSNCNKNKPCGHDLICTNWGLAAASRIYNGFIPFLECHTRLQAMLHHFMTLDHSDYCVPFRLLLCWATTAQHKSDICAFSLTHCTIPGDNPNTSFILYVCRILAQFSMLKSSSTSEDQRYVKADQYFLIDWWCKGCPRARMR